MNGMNGKKTRYLLAGLAALVIILMAVVPIISINAYFVQIKATYADIMELTFSLRDGMSMLGGLLGEIGDVDLQMGTAQTYLVLLGICMAFGIAAVALTLVLSLLPTVSDQACRKAAIAAAVITGLMLIIIFAACIKAKIGMSALSFWYYFLLLALIAIVVVGNRLRDGSSHPEKPNGGGGDGAGLDIFKRAFRGDGSSAASGYLEGRSGMYVGARIPVAAGATVLIGRDPQSANLVIMHQNADISRRHCAVRADGRGNYLVTDYSKNGTFYSVPGGAGNALRLPLNIETPLPHGTTLTLGTHGNVFYLG